MARGAHKLRFAPFARLASGLALLALVSTATAGVLPEDRADVLYHSYDGGGVTIDGPSFLVRKEFASKFSAAANYYVDNVSSASIDVGARPTARRPSWMSSSRAGSRCGRLWAARDSRWKSASRVCLMRSPL